MTKKTTKDIMSRELIGLEKKKGEQQQRLNKKQKEKRQYCKRLSTYWLSGSIQASSGIT